MRPSAKLPKGFILLHDAAQLLCIKKQALRVIARRWEESPPALHLIKIADPSDVVRKSFGAFILNKAAILEYAGRLEEAKKELS